MPVRRRAFALVELLAVLIIAAMVLALLAAAADRSRRLARLGDDIANLGHIGAVTGAFAADNNGLYWSFTWKKGQFNSKYNDLNNAPTDLQAAADQAVDILRRVAGREDIPRITGWLPQLNFNHLVLADYLHGRLPDRMFISSGDANRLLWASDPLGFDQGKFGLKQPPPSPTNKRWPYSASFQTTPIFWSSPVSGPDAISQGSAHNIFMVPAGTTFGACAVSDITHPSQKVFMHDQWAWHVGQRTPYFGLAQARVPILFCDGSASVRATGDAGPGWQPGIGGNLNSTTFFYQPNSWEPPTVTGQQSDLCLGYYRWTRWAREGRDFGGPEIKK